MSNLLFVLVLSITTLSSATVTPTPAPPTPASPTPELFSPTPASPPPTFSPTPTPTPVPTPQPTISTLAPTPQPTSSPTESASYGNIIVWLNTLIAEGQTEIKMINETESGYLQAENTAAAKLTEAETAEGQAAAAMQTASDNMDTRKGEWDTCQSTFSSESVRLNEEIAIFANITDKLGSLINGGAELVEKEKTALQAFISTEDQADPVKVNQIISLLDKLVADNQEELVKIEQESQDCYTRYEEAKSIYEQAVADHEVAKTDVDSAQTTADQAKATYDSYKIWADDRRHVINGEVDQLSEIIELLKPFLE